MTRKIVAAISLLIFLTGCGSSTKVSHESRQLRPPANCNETNVLEALPKDLTNAMYIPTEWQPAPGTDLEAIVKNGGLACTYGIQQAEIGATVSWVQNKNGLFDSRIESWKKSGFEERSIPGVIADKIYVISETAMNAREIHSWSANILANGNWIQVSASYIYKNEDAVGLIKAAISSLR